VSLRPIFSFFLSLSYRVIFRDACVLFKAGKNHDGWFGSSKLLVQVDDAMDIFEGLTKGNAQGLFLFDNASSYQKRAPNAISARKMPKSASFFLFPKSSSDLEIPYAHRSKANWPHTPDASRMCKGKLPTGESQSFYFPLDHPTMPSWFKGMEVIIRECRLWPADGLPAQCLNFQCLPGRIDWCCQWLLFSQPDFTDPKTSFTGVR